MYNNKLVTVIITCTDGYYDEDETLTEEGRSVILDLVESAGFEVNSIEQ